MHVPRWQVVLTIPKRLRAYGLYRRRLASPSCSRSSKSIPSRARPADAPPPRGYRRWGRLSHRRDGWVSAGIAPPTLRVYPVATHIAEKLHGYTMPRTRPNSRTKDLPDLALLAETQAIDAEVLRAALEQTFTHRKTHQLPLALPAPPLAWESPYAAMAREDRLDWATLADVTVAVRSFLDPILAGELDAIWSPNTWSWGRR